jgi:hypothetical protein
MLIGQQFRARAGEIRIGDGAASDGAAIASAISSK